MPNFAHTRRDSNVHERQYTRLESNQQPVAYKTTALDH